jgi:hypothetical protein
MARIVPQWMAVLEHFHAKGNPGFRSNLRRIKNAGAILLIDEPVFTMRRL